MDLDTFSRIEGGNGTRRNSIVPLTPPFALIAIVCVSVGHFLVVLSKNSNIGRISYGFVKEQNLGVQLIVS